MNYFTATISTPLAEKLKEKGMPIEKEGENVWCPSYGEVFDWLMSEKRLALHIWVGGDEHTVSNLVAFGLDAKGEGNFYEAAEKAIEKALELI